MMNSARSATSTAFGLSRAWTITFGVLTLIIGLLVLFWPGKTVLVIAVLFGIQLIVGGIFRLVLSISYSEAETSGRVLYAILGALSIIVGLLCLREPLQTVVVLGLLLGLAWTIGGIVEIVHGFTGEHGSGRGWQIAGGLLSVIAGVIVLVYPGASLVTLAWVMGLLLVFYGAIAIGRAIFAGRSATGTAPAAGRASPATS